MRLALMLLFMMLGMMLGTPASAQFVFKYETYAGGVALNIDTLPDVTNRKAYWAEVERQSRACRAGQQTALPCIRLWSQAMTRIPKPVSTKVKRYDDDFTRDDEGEIWWGNVRKSADYREILPAHFYDDILPQLTGDIARFSQDDRNFYDVMSPAVTVLIWATMWCDTVERCAKFEAGLREHVTGFATLITRPSTQIDYFDIWRLLIALETWRSSKGAIGDSFNYLGQYGLEPCDVCLENVARDLRNRGRAKDAASIETYRADLFARVNPRSLAEMRIRQENLVEAEYIFLAKNHPRILERKLTILRLDNDATKNNWANLNNLKLLCREMNDAIITRNHSIHQFQITKRNCQEHMAVMQYKIGLNTKDDAIRKDAYQKALSIIGVNEYTVEYLPYIGDNPDFVFVVVDWIMGNNFAFGEQLAQRHMGGQYLAMADMRARNGRLDSKTRLLYLTDAMTIMQRYLPDGQGRFRNIEGSVVTDRFRAGSLDAKLLSERRLSIKNWVATNWALSREPLQSPGKQTVQSRPTVN